MVMRSTVYFLDEVIPSMKGIKRLFKALNVQIKGDVVAIKVHMGEYENYTHVHPFYIKKIAELVKEAGGYPLVADTTVIYGLMRETGLGYHKAAKAHGFSDDYLGCPIIIADGLRGEDGVFINAKNKETEIEGIEIARSFYDSDALIVVSHATGHGNAGFGGAIKNVGMGCVTKSGKKKQHEVTKPLFDRDKCTECGKCLDMCVYDAILPDFEIDKEKCTGCGICLACKEGARYTTRKQREHLQKRIAEATSIISSYFDEHKVFYLSFLTDITFSCDCVRSTGFMSPNIGVLAGNDIVAIDKSSVDMIKKKAMDRDKVFLKNFDVVPEIQIERAQELKLGNAEYEIEKI